MNIYIYCIKKYKRKNKYGNKKNSKDIFIPKNYIKSLNLQMIGQLMSVKNEYSGEKLKNQLIIDMETSITVIDRKTIMSEEIASIDD